MNFSSKLKELRAEKGLTQDQLALKTDLSHGCIAMLETGKRAPTGNTLALLADFFEVSTDYLLGRSDDLGVISISSQKEKPAELSPDGKELLDIYNSLESEHRAQILEYARYFAERRGNKNYRSKT